MQQKNRTTRNYFLTGSSNQQGIEIAQRYGLDFEHKISTYTEQLITGVTALDYYIINTEQPKAAFMGYQKIKAAVKRCGLEAPDLEAENVKYFDSGMKEKPQYYQTVLNIDLKAAYPTALYQLGYIDAETYDYILTLNKTARLAACGMLAGRKTVLTYLNGELEEAREDVSETAGYFFGAAYEVGEILEKMAEIWGKSFLFFWVDGIYIKMPEKTFNYTDEWKQTNAFLLEKGYPYTFEILFDFTVEIGQRNTLEVAYEKNKKIKQFKIPVKNPKKRAYLLSNSFK